jgi:hypothetical protein
MQGEFEMSMMGELTYFLGLQIKQLEEGTFTTRKPLFPNRFLNHFLAEFSLNNLLMEITATK